MKEKKELKFDSWRYVLFTGFNEMLDYGKRLEKERYEIMARMKVYSKWLDEQIHNSSDADKKEVYTTCKEKFIEIIKLEIL
jgi:hypothetical protein